MPTRTALELPAAKDKSVDKGAAAAMPDAEAVSAHAVEVAVVPATMKNRPLPDIPKEAVSQSLATSVQSDHSCCTLGVVDLNTKVAF